MKNYLSFICCLGLILIFSNCNKDNNLRADCGCDSETVMTIPDEKYQPPIEEQKSGLLFYKHAEDIDGIYDDDEYNNRFWIYQGTEGCYNCRRNFIICNEEVLGQDFNYLKSMDVSDSIEVTFSGNSKRLCIIKIGPADYDYKEIRLNSIEEK